MHGNTKLQIESKKGALAIPVALHFFIEKENYVKYVNQLMKLFTFYRSLPVDQTFLALMKMIRCVLVVGMPRLLLDSKFLRT